MVPRNSIHPSVSKTSATAAGPWREQHLFTFARRKGTSYFVLQYALVFAHYQKGFWRKKNHAGGDTGALGDLAGEGGVVPLLGEQLAGCLDDCSLRGLFFPSP